MRIADVIGTVTLSRCFDSIAGGRFLLAQPQSTEALRFGKGPTATPVVVLDETSAGLGSRVAISEGREAAMPFHPRLVPIDAYCAAILDEVHVSEPV